MYKKLILRNLYFLRIKKIILRNQHLINFTLSLININKYSKNLTYYIFRITYV